MDDIEVTYHGELPKKCQKTLVDRAINWLYYYGCCLFLIGGIVITPVVAGVIIVFNRSH